MSTAARKYDSTRRRAAAVNTRRRIVEAAGRLFSEHGYAGTSVRAVASAAGSSPESVYLIFGTKAAVLAAWIDVSVAGDDSPVGFVEREEVRALGALTTFDARLAAAMAVNRAVNERVASPLAVLDAAAQSDPDIAALARGIEAARREDVSRLLGVVIGDHSPRSDLDRAAMVDLVAALTSVHLYRALVLGSGWTVRQYEDEVGRQLIAAILS